MAALNMESEVQRKERSTEGEHRRRLLLLFIKLATLLFVGHNASLFVAS